MQIIQPGNPANTIMVGGLCLPISGLKILKTHTNSGAWGTFWDVSFGVQPAAYTPSVGKKFYLQAGRYRAFTASSDTIGMGLFYYDTDIGLNAGAAVNPKGMVSGAATGLSQADYVTSQKVDAGALQEFVQGGVIPNGKYAGVIQGNTQYGIMWLFGYEAA